MSTIDWWHSPGVFKRTVQRKVLLTRLALAISGGIPFLPAIQAQSNSTAAKWEADIKAFEAADKTNPPPRNAILFAGSSSIRFWKSLAQDFPEHKVINRGFGGSQLSDAIAFADRIAIPYHPKKILLYAGDNDLAAGKTPEQVLADFKTYTQRIHAVLPETRIAYIAIKPSLARWRLIEQIKTANRLIQDYGRTDDKLMFIDIFTPMLGVDGEPRKELFVADGLHLNAQGYELWTSIIRPHLNEEK